MKMNLDILPFGRSELEVEQPVEVSGAGADEPVREILTGVLAVDNTTRHVILGGELEAVGEAVCDRCLEDFELRYKVPVDITVVRDRLIEGQDGEQDVDSWVIHQARGLVELQDAFSEALQLARPQKMICREDCRGICPVCGCNRNRESCDCADQDHDPRWDGLPG